MLENVGDFFECVMCGFDGFFWVLVLKLGVVGDKCKKKLLKF